MKYTPLIQYIFRWESHAACRVLKVMKIHIIMCICVLCVHKPGFLMPGHKSWLCETAKLSYVPSFCYITCSCTIHIILHFLLALND